VVAGRDPAGDKIANRSSMTVSELCQSYMADIEAGRVLTRRRASKKLSTIITDRSRISAHIVPLLGRKRFSTITRSDIERFMHDVASGATTSRAKTAKPRGLSVVKGGKGTASRTVGLLGAIFTYAIRQGLMVENPVHGVVRFADGRRLRRLNHDEYRMMAIGLAAAETDGVWRSAIDGTRFMVMTGWRRGEVLSLRWDHLDLARHTARLTDTKTGESIRVLSTMAIAIIQSQPMGMEFVFPARSGGVMAGFRKLWLRMAMLGGLPADVTPHVLRHSYASLASDLGFSEATIASLIGHKLSSITSRYVHSADAVLVAAANTVAAEIEKLMQDDRADDGVDRSSQQNQFAV
jgi:integrase